MNCYSVLLLSLFREVCYVYEFDNKWEFISEKHKCGSAKPPNIVVIYHLEKTCTLIEHVLYKMVLFPYLLIV